MKGLAFIKDPDGYWIEILSARGLASTITCKLLDLKSLIRETSFSSRIYNITPPSNENVLASGTNLIAFSIEFIGTSSSSEHKYELGFHNH